MIIETPRSRIYVLIDLLLTLLAWIAFSYLFVAGLVSILAGEDRGMAVPVVSRLLPAIHTLMVYVIVAACIAAVLFAWAQYNTIRFSQRNRRRMYPVPEPEVLAGGFGITLLQISALRASQRAIIQHTDDGLIDVIDVDNQLVAPSSLRMVA